MSQLETMQIHVFGITIEVQSTSPELISRLRKDFSYFLVPVPKAQAHYRFRSVLGSIPWELLPTLKAKKQSINCITYEDKNFRYNDYYGEALTLYSYKTHEAQVYSHDIERLHEITYLLCLSRSGKRMDLRGLHKIHAMGISGQEFHFVVMMPMKGGKTTLMMNLLERKDFQIISDDSPVIGRNGKVHSFPLRVGLEHLDRGSMRAVHNIDGGKIYQIQRKHYGVKNLIPIDAFSNEVSGCDKKKTLLCLGVRSSGQDCQIVPVSRLKMIRPLMANMVVGLGLPMILEYFLESGIKDILRNSYILASRLWAAMHFLVKTETYFIFMGQDIERNVDRIESFLESR